MKNLKRKAKAPVENKTKEKVEQRGLNPFQAAAMRAGGQVQARGEARDRPTPMGRAMENAAKSEKVRNRYIKHEAYDQPFRKRIAPSRHVVKQGRLTGFDRKKRTEINKRTGVQP